MPCDFEDFRSWRSRLIELSNSVLDLQKWVNNLKTVKDEQIKLAIMTANNHYAGFGPGTANIFRNMLGLPEGKWDEKEEEHVCPAPDSKQRTLSEFLN